MNAKSLKGERPTQNEISAGLQVLAGYFGKFLDGRSHINRYYHTFACGAKAFIRYRQFGRAVLVTIGWPRSCRCESEKDLTHCDRELTSWVAEVEKCEERHFHFRKECSLALDLDESSTLIFRPIETEDL